MRSRIQRQLSRLQRPDFITALEVVGVDPGGAAPTLRNIRALPQPEASIWPQVLFDMRYQGGATGRPGSAWQGCLAMFFSIIGSFQQLW